MTVDVHTGELFEISYADVRRSVETTRTHLEAAAEQVIWQVQNRVWTVLGHHSWDEMREAEYGGAAVIVPRADRPELVAALRREGLSQQQIGDTLGVTQKTVSNDVSSFTNVAPTRTDSLGRRQPTAKPRTSEPEIVDAELIEDDSPPIARPTPEAMRRHEEDRAAQTSREVASTTIARSVWLLATAAQHVDAPKHYASVWQPHQDVYPEPTTAARMRLAAEFLLALAKEWPE